jgi:hypothetical protein
MQKVYDAQIEAGMKGKKFGDLVLYHMNKQSFEQIILALTGMIESLPVQISEEITALIDDSVPLGYNKDFWADDCGNIFRFITFMVKKKLKEKGIQPSEDELFDVFNIIVLNFAYNGHKDSNMKKFIKNSVGGGLLKKVFG